MEAIFWISLSIVFYTYLGYPMILAMLVWAKRRFVPAKKMIAKAEAPEATLIIAAFNEELYIEEKLLNALSSEYPQGKLHIWVVADGSTDQTVAIASGIPGVRVFYDPQRMGKLHAVERVMPYVATPIVIFSDANTYLPPQALMKLTAPFSDARVGAVAGEKRIAWSAQASGQGEGAYWKYESTLKKWDAALSSAMGAAGELFAIRASLYRPVPADTLIEDFVQSMQVVAEGYSLAYEPEAFAVEMASASVEEEMKRKIRIAAGGIQASIRLRRMLNPLQYGIVAWQLLSHRVFRWTLAPVALATILVSNFLLVSPKIDTYALALFTQAICYGLALIGWVYRGQPVKAKGFFIPYYFVVMNICVYQGALRLLRKRQTVIWEKAKRMPTTIL